MYWVEGSARAALFSIWFVVCAVACSYINLPSTFPLTGGGEEGQAAIEGGKEVPALTGGKRTAKQQVEVKGKAMYRLEMKGTTLQRLEVKEKAQ